MKKLRLGILGTGKRGKSVTLECLVPRENVEITALCDVYEDKMQDLADEIVKAGKKAPKLYSDYKDVIAAEDVDAVVVSAAWELHIPMACDAMEAGKPVALEVSGAYSIEDCWKLVRTYEKTKTKVMFMENACYTKRGLAVLNMVRDGLFGEIVHCSGGYRHDLRGEVSTGKERRHYRLRNYLNRNGENYPTHELGPIAKVLNINDGNLMLSLTSTASKSRGIHEFVRTRDFTDKSLLEKTFAQGDMVTTVIKCAHGETITLTLDTCLPRYFHGAADIDVHGTKGLYEGATRSIYLDLDEECDKHHDNWQPCWGNIEKYYDKYEHNVWKKFKEEATRGDHDGVDWITYGAFVDAVVNDYDPPMDVYDGATWMAVTVLSEQSIACGSMPVMIPDFTNGKWLEREKRNFSPDYEI